MSAERPNGGYVTWKALIGTTLTAAGLSIGAVASVNAFNWSQHISQPHRGTITETEYQRDMSQIDLRLQRIEDKVDQLLIKSC